MIRNIYTYRKYWNYIKQYIKSMINYTVHVLGFREWGNFWIQQHKTRGSGTFYFHHLLAILDIKFPHTPTSPTALQQATDCIWGLCIRECGLPGQWLLSPWLACSWHHRRERGEWQHLCFMGPAWLQVRWPFPLSSPTPICSTLYWAPLPDSPLHPLTPNLIRKRIKERSQPCQWVQKIIA